MIPAANQRPVLHMVWNLIRGGTEGQCARIVLNLARIGIVQRVAVFRREGFFLEAIERACGPVHEVNIRAMLRCQTCRELASLCNFVRDHQVALIHAWDADSSIFGAIASRITGVPLITSRRDLGEIYARWKLALMRWADHCASAVVVNATAIAASPACRHVPNSKLRVIPNLIDIVDFDLSAQNPRAPLPALPAGPRVVMVARLDPEKDVATFLRAAARVVKAVPDAKFLIAGDGRERLSVQEYTYRLNLDHAVVFLGEFADVPALLAACDVGVLTPSRNEGLSNTILEYMAARLPVVATDCGGNRELVDPPRGGFIVAVGDDAGLADAIIRLLDNPALRMKMGEHNRARVVRDHQPAAIADQFEDLYRSALRELACRK